MVLYHWSSRLAGRVEVAESSHRAALAGGVVEEAWGLDTVVVASTRQAVQEATVAAVAAKRVGEVCSRRVEPEAEAEGRADLAAKEVMA